MEKFEDTPIQKYISADADYEKAEMDSLRNALKRTYTERFLMMTTLMKMNSMFKKAKIIRTPYTLDK
jgi:hypothetical protein